MSERDLKIKVTKHHIASGNCNPCSCPIALAINSKLKPEYHARVGTKDGNFIDIEYGVRNITQYSVGFPVGVFGFVVRFDDGGKVDPIEVTLPQISERLLK